MPVYTVELDGKQYDLEGDHPPSEAEARSAIGTSAPAPQKATPAPASATIGMMQPSTAQGDPRQASIMGHRLPDSTSAMLAQADPRDVSAEPIGPMPTGEILAGAKSIPGILARIGGVSKERAAQNIAEALQAAKDVGGVAVDMSKPAESGLRGIELQTAKFRMPTAASGIVEKVTKPGAAPIMAQEAHDLASNLSSLSVNETNAVKGAMKPVVSTMAKQTRQALIEALNVIDKGEQYAKGVSEYRRAAVAGKVATRAAQTAAIGGSSALGLGWLRKLLSN